MRRWSFLQHSLPLFLQRPEVAEVIVADETGEDATAIAKQTWAANPKLRVVVNEKRKGIYHNKRFVAGLATTNWIAMLDSDNLFPDCWFETIDDICPQLPEDTKLIFGSALFQSVNMETGEMHQYCKHFDNWKLSKANWNQMLQMPKWNFLLNDGNWVISRGARDAWPADIPVEDKCIETTACDAVYTLREFIKAGFTMWYVPDFTYTHTVHDQSSWLLTDRESTRAMNSIDWRI